jgi:hypothetical protein
MTDTTINVDTVTVEARPATPSINMPDHPIRARWQYQLYVRLARPTLDWITAGGVAWNLIVQPAWFDKFDAAATMINLAWAAAVYGIKTYEKKAGLA